MTKNLSTFLVCVLVSACATEAKYKAKTQSWIGRSASELIQNIGLPDDRLDLPNGNSKLIYTRNNFRDTLVRPGERIKTGTEPLGSVDLGKVSIPYGSKDTYTDIPEVNQTVDYHCHTDFDVNTQGTIVNSTFYGSDCRAN